jgi:long-chain acyl-CoA synthetase
MPSDLKTPATVPSALARAADEFGSKLSYVEGGRGSRALTWAELAQRVEDVAAGLVSMGLRHGDRVAICAQNSIDWIVAYYATVTAGASATLVYFDLKPREITEQVSRPGSRFLFASTEVLSHLGESAPPVDRIIKLGARNGQRESTPTLDDVALLATAEARERLRLRQAAPDDLAAIVYTSGTTGGPKGVMLSHRNLIASAQGGVQAIGVGSDDSALLVLPLHHSFAFTVAAILPALIGASIVFESDLRRIRDHLAQYRPTIFLGVPALFEVMYRNILARAESEGRLPQMLAWQRRVRLVKRLTGVNIGPVVLGGKNSGL